MPRRSEDAPARELRVPARYYARIVEVLGQHGPDFAALLRALRMSPRLLSDPEATLTVAQVDRLVERVFEATRRSDIGFELGKLLTASAHSFVGFGMLNSETLDQALRFEAQYFRLIMPSFRMRYSAGPDFAEIAITPVAAMSPLSLGFHLEAIATAALREVTDLTGAQRPPCRLDLSIPEPAHVRRYDRELRDVRVRFAADSVPGVRLRVLADPCALHLAMADSNARRVAEERCRVLVQQVARGGRFADWVAMTLREVSGALPSVEELASTLNMSKRTLNRYLAKEGTSFQALAGRIQHEIACERLARGDMSVSAVAYSLGFKDRSNFGRAFRARAGYSAGEHRARNARA